MMHAAPMEVRSVLVVGEGREHSADLASGLRRYGHNVLGPVATVEDALALLEGSASLDGAVFDLSRDATWSAPIAEALSRRGVPFVFTAATGRSGSSGFDTEGGEGDASAHQVVELLFRRVRQKASPSSGNRLLALMPPSLSAPLRPHLRMTDVGAGDVLQQPDAAAEHVYFPTTAVLSVVGPASPRRPGAEIALIGFEGSSGITEILGGPHWPFITLVQVAGETQVIEASRFRSCLNEEPELRAFFLRYVQAFLVQAGDTALANARGVLSQRLARRVLMTHDRLGSDVLPLTHQQLATMLGVRRASVTEALHLLEGDGIVRSLRGRLLVRDRAALLEIATGYYGSAEAAYDRLLADDGAAMLQPN